LKLPLHVTKRQNGYTRNLLSLGTALAAPQPISPAADGIARNYLSALGRTPKWRAVSLVVLSR